MANPLNKLVEASEIVDKIEKRVDEVKLLKTTMQDPHVKRILQHVTGGDQSKQDEIEAKVKKRIANLECVAKVSPILYEAALDNIIETVLFDHFWDKKPKAKVTNIVGVKPEEPEPKGDQPSSLELSTVNAHRAPEVKTAPKFETITFNKLVDLIRAESRSFFPLRNMVDFHIIHHPAFTIVGDGINKKLEERYGDIDTAAATADGTFIFNSKFCQALLDFAHLKGIKASPTSRFGKKYVSQGGKIPDEWEYIEFLIRHEIMHYTYSDFHYQDVIPDASAKLINWVGDFRSNHRLVHQGFNQLPMGLFSSYINFHKQSSYQEMYNLVKSEFDKLKDECKQELGDEFNSQTDNHTELDKKKDGERKVVDRKITPEDIDKWSKKKTGEQDADLAAPPDYTQKPPENRQVGQGKGANHELDYSSVSPRYKWDALLKKMVGETSYVIDQTYQKVSRRAIGTMQQVIARGRGAVKPGETKNPNRKKIKLAVIVDSSGSMSYVIQTVMSNLDKLLVQRKGITGVHDEFYLFIFSGDYDIYECSPGSNRRAKHITDVDKNTPGPSGVLRLPEVLAAHKAGGTVFSSDLATQIKKLAARGYNCLIVSDGDMLYGDNFTNFKKLYEGHRKNVWLLLDSKDTFTSFVKQMKEISNNASHL